MGTDIASQVGDGSPDRSGDGSGAGHRLSDALAGRRIVIAVDRRAGELTAALERHGAAVEQAPALTIVPHVDDQALLERTRELLDAPPDKVVATTGVGFRGWIEAADAAGYGAELRGMLAEASILARGPKARGAVQQAGLTTSFVAGSETSAEIGEHLLGLGVDGTRIAVQHHGAGADGIDELLAEHGADVVSLTVYRWGPPPDPALVRRSVERTGGGEIDAVLFTSAPGAAQWITEARRADALPAIRERSTRGELVIAGVGPVTARPLQDEGLPVLIPERSRLGALVRCVVQHYQEDGTRCR